MSEQTTFRYKLWHEEDRDIEEEISSLDFVKDITVHVSVSVSDPIIFVPIRSVVEITITSESEFEKLDDKLEEMYPEIWFEF